jgi:hypothetical protein
VCRPEDGISKKYCATNSGSAKEDIKEQPNPRNLSEVTVLNPGDLFLKVKTCFSQKRYGCVIERLKMRTNENSRNTADDGITLRVFMGLMLFC